MPEEDWKWLLLLLLSLAPSGSGFEVLYCPMSYMRILGAVCGTDATTYLTMCDFENARLINPNLEVAFFHQCKNACDNSWTPVCGTNLRTYGNLCKFDEAAKRNDKLRILHSGECKIYVDVENEATAVPDY